MKRVVICQHRLLHYRVQLFELLRDSCQKRGIQLDLVHGQPTAREATKKDSARLPWAHEVKNSALTIGDRDILWQSIPRRLLHADLTVIMQENRILSNYPILLERSLFRRKVAYWGHGANFQSTRPAGLRETWKRSLLNAVDWWFAYTAMTESLLLEARYPADRITCLNNAIDNDGFRRDLDAVTGADLAQLASRLNVNVDDPIALHCGSLYPEKRLDLLVRAGDAIAKEVPAFTLLVVGSGPMSAYVEEAARSRTWLKPLGAKHGREKAVAFRLSRLVLNPGLVGLHILDACCARLPMVTTSNAMHSPEISYLQNDKNGIVASDDAQTYAEAVLRLLRNEKERVRLAEGADDAARRYTLRSMVDRFTGGIEAAIERPPLRSQR